MSDQNEIINSILLVDDEEDIRDVLTVSITDMGYCVHTAENGQEGLGIFQKFHPAIVITDIKMPLMGGIEFLKKIKHENPETEVIMITGHGDMDLAIKSLKHEATDFITKPINVDALEIAIVRARDKIVIRQKLKEYTENLERLIREKTELQDHLSTLGLMIGSISHGIKGLLTGLDGSLYLVESGFKNKNQDQIQEGWQTVKLMVDRIRKMVLDILFYAKERNLEWEKVDVRDFAEEIATVVESKISGKKIALMRAFGTQLGAVEIDQGYVHSALINIFDNAVDACIKDDTKESHQIAFGVTAQKKYLLFSIKDNGIGMDQETISKIFSLFYSSKGRKGTGFGLFICNKIIEQHGGSIKVESKPGSGSTFIIKIPRSSSHA
jgi:signal transduction histidine kinase